MTDDDFAVLIERGHELRGIEFKPPGPRTDQLLMARIVRAALGMANRRDGGLVIVGVDESTGRPNPIGLAPDALASWSHDDVAATIAASSDPPISIEQEVRTYHDKRFVVLRVPEFLELPVLAKKDVSVGHNHVVRKGACYVRSFGKPETSEIPSQTEMRDLLDLAIQKGLRRFVAQAAGAGLITFGPGTPSSSSDQQFRKQLDDLG